MLEMDQNFADLSFQEGSNISSHLDRGAGSLEFDVDKSQHSEASPHYQVQSLPPPQNSPAASTQHHSQRGYSQQNSQAEPRHPTLEEYWKLYQELSARDAQEGRQWPGRSEMCLRIHKLEEDPLIKDRLFKG